MWFFYTAWSSFTATKAGLSSNIADARSLPVLKIMLSLILQQYCSHHYERSQPTLISINLLHFRSDHPVQCRCSYLMSFRESNEQQNRLKWTLSCRLATKMPIDPLTSYTESSDAGDAWFPAWCCSSACRVNDSCATHRSAACWTPGGSATLCRVSPE